MQGQDPNYVRVMSCPRCGAVAPVPPGGGAGQGAAQLIVQPEIQAVCEVHRNSGRLVVRREGDRVVLDVRADQSCVLALENLAVIRLFRVPVPVPPRWARCPVDQHLHLLAPGAGAGSANPGAQARRVRAADPRRGPDDRDGPATGFCVSGLAVGSAQ